MANELNASVSLSFLKSDAQVQAIASSAFDVTGDAYGKIVQEVGTTEEELNQPGEVGTPGWTYVRNLDDTNYVEIGCVTTSYTIKLKAGEFCLFRASGSTIYAKANTAACNVEFCVVED